MTTTMTMNETQLSMINIDSRPWFREPMVWMIIAIPFISVVVGIGMLTMSIKSYDGLVVDDYYKRGKEINRILKRAQVAETNRIFATINWSTNKQVIVSLDHMAGLQVSDQLTLNMRHRTRAGLDLTVVLIRYADGLYRGDIRIPVKGLWVMQIETQDWLIEKQISLPGSTIVGIGYK